MIDLKSNLDHLESLAADFHSDGHAQTAADFRTAIMDIQNLRDYVWQLEKNATAAANESRGIASALLAAVSPDLDRRIDDHLKAALTDSRQLDALEARIEAVEQFKDDLDTDSVSGLETFVDGRIESSESDGNRDDATRDTVRDMIRDGDIIVTVDLS